MAKVDRAVARALIAIADNPEAPGYLKAFESRRWE